MPNKRLLIVLAVLAGGAVLATLGTADARVGLSSVLSLWSDVLRDVDQIGMKATRASDAEEMRLGAELAAALLPREVEDPVAAARVEGIARRLTPHVRRRGIQYEFHVIESGSINAFALPGGKIFLLRGTLGFVQSDDELASVIGHEIAHVDLRHCIERYQYALKLRKAGAPRAGQVFEIAHRLATIGFAQHQELEADAQGRRMASQSGYDPKAASALFLRMKAKFGEPSRRQATTPAGEVATSLARALGDYFRTHPPLEDRAR
jgi:predicted Zn-dependent protease